MAKKNVKWIVFAAIVMCIIAAYLIYTRPLTIEQRYPLLNISDCSEIKGYYFVAPGVENIEYYISAGDSRFSELIQLIKAVEIKKKLSNFLPQGTKTHPLSDGDFKWELSLNFDDVSFPNGDHGRGYMLHLNNFFGDFSISFDGEQTWYSISNQEQWLKEIMNIMTK